MNLKPKRYENREYLNFIKSKPCCICETRKKIDPHHTKSKGSGGSDLTAIPLCRRHHRICHDSGIETFQKKHQIDFKEIKLGLLQDFIEMNFK
jgi:hypothetical protein